MPLISTEQKKVIMLSSLGGAFEYYDFVIFAFFAKTLAQLFFPGQDAVSSLMETFAVFAVGYFARPLGGFLFGHFGDKRGRKKSFVFTLILMALPTLLIGLLPTYSSVGVYAPIGLVILRLLQGLSVGGEIPGATVFILETMRHHSRGFAIGLVFLGINTGLLSGSLVTVLLHHVLTEQQLLAWGWRLPFIFGGILGVMSFFLRRRLQETPVFQGLEQKAAIQHFPAKEVFVKHFPLLIQGIIITSLEAVIVSVTYLFMPTYLSTFFNFSLNNLMTLNTVVLFFLPIPILYASSLSDKIGRKKLIFLSAIGFLLFAFPIFSLFLHHSWGLTIFAIILLALLTSPIAGCFSCMTAELFPTAVRYSGVALCYNLGFGIVGGLTPLMSTWLIHRTGCLLAPSFFLIAMALLALVALIFMPETYRKEIG